jgi:hypothetical protein
MGVWSRIKQSVLSQGRTQAYDEDDAMHVIKSMRHNQSKEILLSEFPPGEKAPLDRIKSDENLLYVFQGTGVSVDEEKKGSLSQLIITSERVLIIAQGVMPPTQSAHSISYSDINGTAVQRQYGLEIELHTAGHTYVINPRSDPSLVEEAADYIQSAS